MSNYPTGQLKEALGTVITFRASSQKSLEWIGKNDPAYLDCLLDQCSPDNPLFGMLVLVCDYYQDEIATAVSLRVDKIRNKVLKRPAPRIALPEGYNAPVIQLGSRVPYSSLRQAAFNNKVDEDLMMECVQENKELNGMTFIWFTPKIQSFLESCETCTVSWEMMNK